MSDEDNQIFIWTDDLSVDNEIIDTQHKALLKKLGVLSFALKTGEGIDKLQDTLDFLEKYVVEHFDYEEQYMFENEYPLLEEHKKIHAQAKIVFKDMILKFYQPNIDKITLAAEVEEYMRIWWIDHIRNVDGKYAQYIRERRRNSEKFS